GPAAAAVAGVGGDAAVLAEAFLDTVAVAQAGEVMPLDHARCAAALGGAGDIDALDILEHVRGVENRADLDVARLVEPEFRDVALRLGFGLRRQLDTGGAARLPAVHTLGHRDVG